MTRPPFQKPSIHPYPILVVLILLLLTAGLGLIMRWQLAGVPLPSEFLSTELDWRRAHTHLGFYAVLFPIAWLLFKQASAWVPKGRLLSIYISLSVLSSLAFLLQGYGFFSIFTSTLILAAWLLFAWHNHSFSKIFQRDWIAPVSLSILVVGILIFMVAATSSKNPELASKLVRAFLTVLLFGVFVPASLNHYARTAPHAWMWLLALFSGTIYLVQLSTNPIFGLGLVGLGVLMIHAIAKELIGIKEKWRLNKKGRILVYWFLLAVPLILIGLGLVPLAAPLTIAGLHFMILGPIVLSFFYQQAGFSQLRVTPLIYECFLLIMVGVISLQGVIKIEYFYHLQILAALSGTGITIMIAYFSYFYLQIIEINLRPLDLLWRQTG